MDAKVKGQGHKVTHDENAQFAENLVNTTFSKSHDIVKIKAQYTLHNLFHRDISQDMFNQCPSTFRPRIRLMNLPRSPFSLKAGSILVVMSFLSYISFLSHNMRSAISLLFFIESLPKLADI